MVLSSGQACLSHADMQIWLQIVVNIQAGAPPITCILNNFVAICAYIKEGGWCVAVAPSCPLNRQVKR